MTMCFAYKRLRTPHPVISLDGRAERPRGLITVSFGGPLLTSADLSLLDTGSDDTVLPEWFAARIGIDLTNAPTATLGGIGATPGTLRFAKIRFRIADNQERREWQGWAGFTSVAMRQPLLGFSGFL